MTLSSQSLGKRIRELRQAKGLSMRELAAGAKLKSVAFIADLEKGFRYPSPEVLANLAASLEVPVGQLKIYDQRAPLHEIRELNDRDPEWASALRQLVDAANRGLTPRGLIHLLQNRPAAKETQVDLLSLGQ